MIAADRLADAAWSWLAAGVLVVVLAALAIDRIRLRRRLNTLERSEALLETDLADARRQVDDLRACLRDPKAARGDPTATEEHAG